MHFSNVRVTVSEQGCVHPLLLCNMTLNQQPSRTGAQVRIKDKRELRQHPTWRVLKGLPLSEAERITLSEDGDGTMLYFAIFAE